MIKAFCDVCDNELSAQFFFVGCAVYGKAKETVKLPFPETLMLCSYECIRVWIDA